MGDELTGVELCNHAFQDFVDDRGKNSFIVVCAKRAVDLWKSVDAWTRQDTAGDVHHLQVFGTGQGGDVARFGADIVGYGCFEPWDFEVGSCVHHEQQFRWWPQGVDIVSHTFIVDLLLNTTYSCVLDCSVATVDYPEYQRHTSQDLSGYVYH